MNHYAKIRNQDENRKQNEQSLMNHYAKIRNQDENRKQNEQSQSCIYSTGIAIVASVALSMARGLSFALLRNKTNRFAAFRNGTRVAFCIYTPIFLICTQLDCMDRMFSSVDHHNRFIEQEKRSRDADEMDKWI